MITLTPEIIKDLNSDVDKIARLTDLIGGLALRLEDPRRDDVAISTIGSVAHVSTSDLLEFVQAQRAKLVKRVEDVYQIRVEDVR